MSNVVIIVILIFVYFQIPRDCSDLHHEVELGVVIQSKCKDIPMEEAFKHVGGYALTLDMTARDFQSVAKVIIHFSAS